jgi:hypothetical protein
MPQTLGLSWTVIIFAYIVNSTLGDIHPVGIDTDQPSQDMKWLSCLRSKWSDTIGQWWTVGLSTSGMSSLFLSHSELGLLDKHHELGPRSIYPLSTFFVVYDSAPSGSRLVARALVGAP